MLASFLARKIWWGLAQHLTLAASAKTFGHPMEEKLLPFNPPNMVRLVGPASTFNLGPKRRQKRYWRKYCYVTPFTFGKNGRDELMVPGKRAKTLAKVEVQVLPDYIYLVKIGGSRLD